MTYYDVITEIFKTIEERHLDGKNNILPTALFNEGWMLRLVLDWFSKNRGCDFDVSFEKDAHWFSEGRLETIFKNENYTEADGVFGNITIGTQGALNKEISAKGISDIRLEKNCRQLVVIEAKMFSGFSKGVTNAKDYDQVARYAACISHVIHKSGVDINNINDLAFYVFLPDKQKKKPEIYKYLAQDQIIKTVKERVDGYCGENKSEINEWYNNAFLSFMEKAKIKLISWEEILDFIKQKDLNAHKMLSAFYSRCLQYKDLTPTDTVDFSLLE